MPDVNPDINNGLNAQYDKTKSNLLANAEAQKAAARRKIEQQYSNRLGSGAVAKLQQEGDQAIDVGTEQNMSNVDLQKAQDARQERLLQQGQQFQSQEAQKGREFSTGERLGTQQFAAQQGQEQRGFLTGERLGGQQFQSQEAGQQRQFQSGEAGKQREFATGERVGSQEFSHGENAANRGLQQQQIDLGTKQFEEQKSQFAQEFQQNLTTAMFNKIVALKDFDIGKLDEISRIMGTDVQHARQSAGLASNLNTPGRGESESLLNNRPRWNPSSQTYSQYNY